MIIKRTGSVTPFESGKILRAIEKAFVACGSDLVPDTIKKAVRDNEATLGADDTKDPVHIERIQDFVENLLLDQAPREVALSFIRYRTQHAIARQEYDPINIIETYLRRSDDMLERENSSMAFSLQGLHNAIFSAGSEQYWKKVMPREAIEAHDTGRIHLHDMSYIAPYCCGWDLKQLLEDGFQNGMKNKTDSAPAGHFGTALGQMCNFIYTVQGESAGAQSFSNVNTLLAPFVKKDGLTYKQVKQKVQEHIHNLNIPTRVGYQSPFSNYTFDLDVTKTNMAKDPIIISGKYQDTTYDQYQTESRMIAEAFVEVMVEGDANKALFPYPIVTFNVSKDFPWSSKLGKLIASATVKYGPFYFGNYINSELAESDVKSMCCRLRLDMSAVNKHVESGLFTEDLEKTHQRGGGFFGADALTGSIAVATISMPAMAHDAKVEIDKECELTKASKTSESYRTSLIDEMKYNIKKHMDISMQAISLRRKVIELCMENGLYPYMKFYMRNIKARTGKYFSQHFNTIGHNGMHEALKVLGYNGITSPEGYAISLDVLKFMNEYTVELQKEYGVLVNLEQTPAESAGVKLCRKSGIDPEIKGYYTNSTWFPAEYEIDPVDLVKKQAELNKYYTGGSALHIYTYENLLNSEEMVGKFITKVFTATNLPYLSISPVFSICTSSECTDKYSTGENYYCPHCGSKAIPYARIVGYYRPIDNWNDGRKEEQRRRVGFELLKPATPAMIQKEEPKVPGITMADIYMKPKQILRELTMVMRII